MEGNEKDVVDTYHELEVLSTKLDDKMVVSLDEVNCEKAGNDLKWSFFANFGICKANS